MNMNKLQTTRLTPGILSVSGHLCYFEDCLNSVRSLFWGNGMHLVRHVNLKQTTSNVVSHCLLCMVQEQAKTSDITNSCQVSPGGEKAMEGRPNSAPGKAKNQRQESALRLRRTYNGYLQTNTFRKRSNDNHHNHKLCPELINSHSNASRFGPSGTKMGLLI